MKPSRQAPGRRLCGQEKSIRAGPEPVGLGGTWADTVTPQGSATGTLLDFFGEKKNYSNRTKTSGGGSHPGAAAP